MHTTPELIELAKQRLALKHGLTQPITDYRFAKLMEFKQQNVSAWQTGKTGIGTQFAAQFAEVCELPEEYVYACIEHEREKDPAVQSILARIADAFRNKVAVLAAILAIGAFAQNAGNLGVSDARAAASDIHYAKRPRIPRTRENGSRFPLIRFFKLRRLRRLRALRALYIRTLNSQGALDHVPIDHYDVCDPIGERLRALRARGYTHPRRTRPRRRDPRQTGTTRILDLYEANARPFLRLQKHRRASQGRRTLSITATPAVTLTGIVTTWTPQN